MLSPLIRVLTNPYPRFPLPNAIAADPGPQGRLWALHIPDRVILDIGVVQMMRGEYPRNLLKFDGERVTMSFLNGTAVYVLGGPVAPDLVPAYMPANGEFSWLYLERWEPS